MFVYAAAYQMLFYAYASKVHQDLRRAAYSLFLTNTSHYGRTKFGNRKILTIFLCK
jgi:hypothetical protein